MPRIELPVINGQDSNPCLTSCEKSPCCSNMFFFYVNEQELKRLTPEGSNHVRLDSVRDIPSSDELIFLKPGVYSAQRGKTDKFALAIAGNCPNLSKTGECTIYDSRPSLCKNFEVGASECNKARKKIGLESLTQNL